MWTEDKDNCDPSERVAGTESPFLLALTNYFKGRETGNAFVSLHSECLRSLGPRVEKWK